MNDFLQNFALSLPGFLFAIVIHEWSHAYVAHLFGDDTAVMSGRLTLNPVAHYDVMGTIIFPLLGAMLGGLMFGWAKPVPVDPRRFSNVKRGIFWVSFAGPLANIIMAVLSAFFVAATVRFVPDSFSMKMTFVLMFRQAIFINLLLAVFNLIPFPPLDGSKMVSTFLDYNAARKYEELGRYSFVFIIILWTTNIFSYLMRPAIAFGNEMMSMFVGMLS